MQVDPRHVIETAVRHCKATYPKIWCGCDWGALISIVCHRKVIPDKVSITKRICQENEQIKENVQNR